MNTRALSCLLALVLAVALLPAAALAQQREPVEAPVPKPSQALEDPVQIADRGAKIPAVSVMVDGPGRPRVEQRPARSLQAAASSARALQQRPDVIAADVEVTLRVAERDPLRDEQWALSRLDAAETWELGDAEQQTIAIVDSGIEASHPDLAEAVVPGWSAFGDGDGTSDGNGHGTAVAGAAAAVVGNGTGIAGLGKAAELMPIKVVKADGSATGSDTADGIMEAADRGAAVINLSLGTPTDSSVIKSAIEYAIDQGAVVAAAAGNEAQEDNPVTYPAAYDDVLGVGAINREDERAEFSNYGDWVDIAAPGTRILTTGNGDSDDYGWCLTNDCDYAVLQGTSLATPFVSAAAALTGANTELGPTRLAAHLEETAEDLGAEGKDPNFGHGLVDPEAALATEPSPTDSSSSSPSPSDSPSPSPSPSDSPSPSPSPSDSPSPSPSPTDSPSSSEPTVVHVGDEPELIETGVEVSQAAFPDDGSASRVVLARDDAFADSLAGSPLAGTQGPILYTTGGSKAPLSPATADELDRVLQPDGTVFVLGGSNAVSTRAAENAAALGYSVQRLSGPTRVETALSIAEAVDAAPERVLVARAGEWADAVTGGAYAAATNQPVVLTGSQSLHPALDDYLQRHQPEPTMLGGEVALSADVAAALGAPTRVAGASRAGTAGAIADELWGAEASPGKIVVADGYAGQGWGPALAAAALSARTGAPQLLSAGDKLPSATVDYLGGASYTGAEAAEATVVGPTADTSLDESLVELLSD
jgi:subtilisin family serine protease/putative cell wall-binding protein